jgi:hypothetical protein
MPTNRNRLLLGGDRKGPCNGRSDAVDPHRHGRLLMANPEFSRAQAVSAVRARQLILDARTSQNYYLMMVVDRHTMIVFGANTA